ncbi:MAG: hypothetical protein BWY09_00741 [Candidatus Hydrogenedentes bacterium ADurb.Bin179]|nr:MAG: hypothetical protein BWY09_00741 [Candidatus Hydrogenedentes bacterium ADurb.Bin179]
MFGFECKPQACRFWKRFLEHGRHAVRRYHVKTDARQGHDTGLSPVVVALVDIFKHSYFAGHIQIMHSCRSAGLQQRTRRSGEGARAVQDRRGSLKPFNSGACVCQVKNTKR